MQGKRCKHWRSDRSIIDRYPRFVVRDSPIADVPEFGASQASGFQQVVSPFPFWSISSVALPEIEDKAQGWCISG
jgi:hypothetical protein